MAARKLQSEIDRTLKKVSEGVELFESIYEKMQGSTNQTQKEKQETDLKTQIKKLQRLRDQIKTWVASNDIKDKTQLLDNRRLIETQMEKFKACEKEMKTKAFSKEGLASARLDPKAQEKLEITHWVQTKVEELQQQIEATEAELESLQVGGKKKKTASQTERLENLEHLNERRKWHISRLEIILRLMDNGSLKADKVKDIQDDVTYFVDNNSEEEFDEYEGMYDEFKLDEQEELWGLAAENEDGLSEGSDDESEDVPHRTPSKKPDDEPVVNHKRDREPPASPLLKKAPARKTSIAADAKPPPSLNFSTPMSNVVKAGLPPAPRPPAPLPPIRYAAAAAAAVTPAASSAPRARSGSIAAQHPPAPAPAPPMPTTPSVSGAGSTPSAVDPSSSPSLTHPSVTSPMLSTAPPASSRPESPAISEAPSPPAPSVTNGTTHPTHDEPQPVRADSAPRTNTNGSSVSPAPSLPSQLAQGPPPGLPASPMVPLAVTATQPAFPPGVKPPTDVVQPPARPESTAPLAAAVVQAPTRSNAFPGSLSDLVQSFENVKQKAAHRMSNLDQVQKMLESGQSTAPQPQDTDKPRYYVPKHPYQVPAYYPQTPHAIVSSSAIFQQLDVETLFYVFYYHPGTYQQFLAAKELKKQSWRFHTKYLTWFQRHSEPQAITDEYEQGVYVYFDWEGSWCQRKKSDFRFEYRYLSEE